MNLHVLTVVAQADGTEKYPDGERHALLVYASAMNLASAITSTPAHLVECGWQDAEVRDAREISSDVSAIVDDILRNAASAALQDGYSIVVYATPITD
ncbi:hypothetical protein HB777_27150 [Mesorhizobium loti]|nr:hypothetical protein HB777_27150 [Mesorhizobium loti]